MILYWFRYLWEIGQYEEALARLERLEKLCTQSIGLETLEAARIYVVRGSVFSTFNRYSEAGELFQKALIIREQLLPSDDQMLANSYMQVGNFYISQERYDEAIESHTKVIKIRKKSSSPAPGMMIISYFNLSRSLLMARKLKEAEETLESAASCEKGVPKTNEVVYYKCWRVGPVSVSSTLTKCVLQPALYPW